MTIKERQAYGRRRPPQLEGIRLRRLCYMYGSQPGLALQQ